MRREHWEERELRAANLAPPIRPLQGRPFDPRGGEGDEVQAYLLRDGDVVKVGMHRLVYTDLREVDKRDIKESVVSEKQAL